MQKPIGGALRVASLVMFAGALGACSATGTQQTPNVGLTSGQASASRSVAVTQGKPAQNHAVSVARNSTQGALAGIPQTTTGSVYDSIVTTKTGKVGSNISSLGFECCSTKEFGDGVVFTKAGSRLKTVQVVMSSWGCENGSWSADNCETTPGTGFSLPITMNVYAVTGYPSGTPGVGALLASKTKTFLIPYRPSKNDTICTGQNLGAFLGKVDKECDNGLSVVISTNFMLPKVILPNAAIVSVAYNTSDAGYNPVGDNTQCFGSSGGCGYDSLNVSADGNGGFVGGNVDPNGVFVNFGNTSFYCAGMGSGFQLDTPCWTGFHPEIKVIAN
jgi:hypothetical protein